MRKTCPKCGKYTVEVTENRKHEKCYDYFCDYAYEEPKIKDIAQMLFSGKYDNMTIEEFKKEVGI